MQGLDDPRSGLIAEVFRVIDQLPRLLRICASVSFLLALRYPSLDFFSFRL